MLIVKLTKSGVVRVLFGAEGMSFVVDECTPSFGSDKPNVHVRDYRRKGEGESYVVWSLGPDDYEVLPLAKAVQAEFHKMIAPILSKRDQGRVMGAFRTALGFCDINGFPFNRSTTKELEA